MGSDGIVEVGDPTEESISNFPRHWHGPKAPSVTHCPVTREAAEVALSRLQVADTRDELPSGGTNAHSVGAAMDLYQHTAQSGPLDRLPWVSSRHFGATRTGRHCSSDEYMRVLLGNDIHRHQAVSPRYIPHADRMV
jgi:hypothetical protein